MLLAPVTASAGSPAATCPPACRLLCFFPLCPLLASVFLPGSGFYLGSWIGVHGPAPRRPSESSASGRVFVSVKNHGPPAILGHCCTVQARCSCYFRCRPGQGGLRPLFKTPQPRPEPAQGCLPALMTPLPLGQWKPPTTPPRFWADPLVFNPRD